HRGEHRHRDRVERRLRSSFEPEPVSYQQPSDPGEIGDTPHQHDREERCAVETHRPPGLSLWISAAATIPATAPDGTCHGERIDARTSAAVTALAAMTPPLRRPVLSDTMRAMKMATNAKSAPRRFGSPSTGPSSAPTNDHTTQFAQNAAPMTRKYVGEIVPAVARRSASAQFSSASMKQPTRRCGTLSACSFGRSETPIRT